MGQVTLNGAAATFEMNDIATGPRHCYAGPKGRTIAMEPLFGGWYGQVTPRSPDRARASVAAIAVPA